MIQRLQFARGLANGHTGGCSVTRIIRSCATSATPKAVTGSLRSATQDQKRDHQVVFTSEMLG